MKAMEAEKRRFERAQPDDLPEPAMGFCVVRLVLPDETVGGILIPDQAQTQHGTMYMVRTSGNVIIGGVLIPHHAKPGDRITPLPAAPVASGPPQLPENHFVYRLDHICAHWPKASHETDAGLQ